jgi:hypothetical protein
MDKITSWRRYKHIPDLPNVIELPQVYPDAKKVIEIKIKEYKQELKELSKKAQEIKKWTISKCSDYTKLDLLIETNQALGLGERPEKVQGHLNRLERLQLLFADKQVSNNYINKESVKDIPISEYLEFNKANKCKCIWHNDASPSLHYYPKNNTVYCFSCSKSGDIIDVIMQLNGCDFRQALKILSK